VTDVNTWSTLTTGAYVNYNNDESYVKTYGRLYNWYVGADPRGLIVGWHTPTIDEWSKLSKYLGGYINDGIATMEAGHAHWGTTARTATNSSGFTALPNGGFTMLISTQKYGFSSLSETASFWESTTFNGAGDVITIESSVCGMTLGLLYNKNYGLGLRVIKN
ncbi:MAG: FISUMP domain-containing protein, partial [Paludibacter sp.]